MPDVVRRYKGGQTLEEVASATGLAADTVRRVLDQEKVQIRPAGRKVAVAPTIPQHVVERGLDQPCRSACARCGWSYDGETARQALWAFRAHRRACAAA